jgi:hypothetical protein
MLLWFKRKARKRPYNKVEREVKVKLVRKRK